MQCLVILMYELSGDRVRREGGGRGGGGGFRRWWRFVHFFCARIFCCSRDTEIFLVFCKSICVVITLFFCRRTTMLYTKLYVSFRLAPANFLTRSNVTGVPNGGGAHASTVFARSRYVHEFLFPFFDGIYSVRVVLSRHFSHAISFSRFSHLFHVPNVDVIAFNPLSGPLASRASSSHRGNIFARRVRIVSRRAKPIFLWVQRLFSTRSRCSRCRCCCCLRTGNVVIVIIRSIHFLEVFCATMRLFGSILLRRGEHSAYFRGIFFRVFLYVRDKAWVRLTHFITHGTSSDFVLFEQSRG